MAWQDVAGQTLGAQAPAVIQFLSQIDPNYDWSRAIQEYTPTQIQQFGGGYLDPSRTSPAGIAQGLAQTRANYDGSAVNGGGFAAHDAQAISALDQQRLGQAATIQSEQATHGGGGFLGLGDAGNILGIGALALGGAGLAGFGPAAGLFGGAADVAGNAGIDGMMNFAGGAGGTAAGGGAVDMTGFMNGGDPFATTGSTGLGNYSFDYSSPFPSVTAPATGVPGFDTPGQVVNLAGGGMTSAAQPSFWDAVSKYGSNAVSAVKNLMSSGGTATDLSSLLGKIAPAALGYLGATNQADQFSRLADRYSSYGAPYRDRLAALYANPDSFLSSNEVQQPIQQAANINARALSTTGNPIGSGNAMQAMNDFTATKLFSRLGEEKDRLGNLGGISVGNSVAPSLATSAINSNAGAMNAVGAGFSNVFNPTPTLAQTMADFKRLSAA